MYFIVLVDSNGINFNSMIFYSSSMGPKISIPGLAVFGGYF